MSVTSHPIAARLVIGLATVFSLSMAAAQAEPSADGAFPRTVMIIGLYDDASTLDVRRAAPSTTGVLSRLENPLAGRGGGKTPQLRPPAARQYPDQGGKR